MLDNTGYGPSLRRRGSGNVLTHTAMAVLGAALATGLLLAFYNPGSGNSGISLPGSGAVPAPAPAAPLAGGEQAIVTKVKPGLVIINTALKYNSEAAAGTGMVINADGLVLTNNHVIDDSTKITATVAATGRTYPSRRQPDSRSRLTRRCQWPGRSPGAKPAPPSRSATRRSSESSSAPDRAAARRRRHSRRSSSRTAAAAPEAARPATPAMPT
jgi:hypothetical protein